MATYDVGDSVALSWALGSAGTVVLTVTAPDGTTSTPAVSGSSTYTATVSAAQAGRYTARWVSTGATVAAHVDVFDVWPTDPRLIISLDDAKAALNITTTTHDDELRLYVAACTDVIEDIAGPVLRRTLVETFDGAGDSLPLSARALSVTSVTEDGVTLAASDYVLNAGTGVVTRVAGTTPLLWSPGCQNVTVTYVAGASSVPPHVVLAARELLRHLYAQGQQGSRPAFGSSEADMASTPSGFAVPLRVLELLAPRRAVPGLA